VPLTVTEKIDWLNSQEYSKITEMSDNEPYLISKFISGMNLKDSDVDINELEDQKQNPSESTVNKSIMDEQEIDRVKAECEELKMNIEEIEQDIKKLMSEINHATLIQQNEKEALATYEEQCKIKMRAYELLENGDENIIKLEETIEAYVDKLVNLANQWEKRRVPLIDLYRSLKENFFSKGVSSIRNF
jgi:predicted  nucleic acid-binding Zn-ribbon protein